MGNEQLTKARSRIWSPPHNLRSVPLSALTIASVGFIGLSPIASGTIGSAAAAALYYLLPFLHSNWLLTAAICFTFVLGAISTDIVELKTGQHDPGIVVIDEVVGQWIALFSWWYSGDVIFIIAAFLFFRVFDILKPYPAKIFERSSGGSAVMLDDVAAGFYACIAANLTVWMYYSIK